MAEQAHAGSRPLDPVINSADPPLRHPLDFVRNAFVDLRRSGPLAFAMTKRDVIEQYRQSWLGIALILLPPLAMALLGMGFKQARILNVEALTIPYGLFVLCGVVLWTTFIEALNAPIDGLRQDQQLLSRTDAPPEAIILGKLGAVLFNFCVKISILAGAMLWFELPPPPTLALAPLGLLSLLALGTGVGLILGTFNLIYNDVSKILSAVTTFWFFITPVYFTVPKEGMIKTAMELNPVTYLLDGTRTLATAGMVPDPLSWIPVLLAPFALFVVAWIWARVSLPVLIERIN